MNLPEGTKIFFSETDIAERVAQLGAEISSDYTGKALLLIAITNGSVPFAADLMRKINLELYFDTIKSASYQGLRSGDLKISEVLKQDLGGRHVLLVDDILDTGKTLQGVREFLLKETPASLKTCVLLDKKCAHTPGIKADYTGFTIGNSFVFGYGLDDADNRYRNLPFIAGPGSL